MPRLLAPLLLIVVACAGPGGRPAAEDSGGDAATDPARRADARTADARPAADPRAVCDTIDNSFRCARAIERRQLPREPAVTRRGDTLRLAVTGGDTVRLVDQPGEGGDVAYHSYQTTWEGPGLFLVQRQFYEGSEYLLIDRRTGTQTAVPRWPLPAPGDERFAVLSFDLVAGYSPNTLQLWSLGPGPPRLVWDTVPAEWGPTDGEWLGPERLRFTRSCPPGFSAPFCGTSATLERAADGWGIREGSGGA